MKTLLIILFATIFCQYSFAQTNETTKKAKKNVVLMHQAQVRKKYERLGLQKSLFKTEKHQINYFDGGKGPVLMLLHGFGGDGSITWTKQVKSLSKNYRLIIPDLCWFGESKSAAAPILESQIYALIDLLDSLDVEKYSVAGLSYGGFVSLGLAVYQPERIHKLVIVDSPGHTYDRSELDSLAHKMGVEKVEDIFVPNTPKDIKRLLHVAMKFNYWIPNRILKRMQEVHFSRFKNEQRNLLRTLQEREVIETEETDMTQFDCAVIWGKEDEVFPIKEGRKLAAQMKADFFVIEKAGHLVNFEKSKKFNKVLMSFLRN